MSDSFSKIIAALLVIVMMFIFPCYYAAQKLDSSIQNYLIVKTSNFCENVKKQGKIDQEMYNNFMAELDATGLWFDVQMEYVVDNYVPVVNDGSVQETTVERVQSSVYTDEIIEKIYTDTDTGGRFLMEKGGMFTIEVRSKQPTLCEKMSTVFLGQKTKNSSMFACAGGMIRDENY